MYAEGSFPRGTLYSIPELAQLAGKHPGNAWLYGTFVLKEKSDGVWRFHSYRKATGLLLDTFDGEGGTTVLVEFPGGAFPRMNVGQVISVGKLTPFEIQDVEKGADQAILVHARSRYAAP